MRWNMFYNKKYTYNSNLKLIETSIQNKYYVINCIITNKTFEVFKIINKNLE